jgi:glucose-1-phosphate thymidylyltransferase
MRGVVLAGGTGSRLYPLTSVVNKHLLPVGRQPMIYYPIQKMREIGIQDILVVTGTEHMGTMVNCLGSGKAFDCEFTYRVQDEPGGIAQALRLAKGFVGDHDMCVILGDNIFEEKLTDAVSLWEDTQTQDRHAMICITRVMDPTRFGVVFTRDSEIVKLTEKPTREELGNARLEKISFQAIIGVYFYKPDVFSIIDELKPSARNELEITDVNRTYYMRKQLYTYEVGGWWTDAGTFESLEAANHFVAAIS